MEENQKILVGIIGGGKGGQALLESLLKSGYIDIQFVVDKDPNACAFALAKEHRIPTLVDIDAALKNDRVKYIFEATGVEKVLEILKAKCSAQTEIIDHRVSLFFFDLMEKTRKNINYEIINELGEVKKTLTDNSRIIQDSLKEVERVATNISLLSINASIEAAHAGEAGKGFAVVAQAVKNTAESARDLSSRIEGVNKESVEVTTKIDSSLKKLTS
jgi:septum formation inhibitor-activating ATPase MinD